jgi:transcriptional repressor NrdR
MDMVCIYCGGETKVTNSRLQKRNNQVWRRRQCLSCSQTFTTHEVIELESALSITKNGVASPFLPDRLLKELLVSLQDRKDAYTAARELLSTVIRKLLALPGSPLFEPAEISRETADVLKKFDKRAYLRFIAEHPSAQSRRVTL